jgi:hypothetical protein
MGSQGIGNTSRRTTLVTDGGSHHCDRRSPWMTSSMKNLIHTTVAFIAQGPFYFCNKWISFLTNWVKPRVTNSRTGEGDQRGVNGSQSNFLIGT